jgi:hypothetical protein
MDQGIQNFSDFSGKGHKSRSRDTKSNMKNFLDKEGLLFNIRELNHSLDKKIASIEAIKDSDSKRSRRA